MSKTDNVITFAYRSPNCGWVEYNKTKQEVIFLNLNNRVIYRYYVNPPMDICDLEEFFFHFGEKNWAHDCHGWYRAARIVMEYVWRGNREEGFPKARTAGEILDTVERIRKSGRSNWR